jgi:hypothetical protein
MLSGRGLAETDNLSRIEDVERVEGALGAPHGGERRFAEFGLKILHLSLADAVLAGAGSVHGQRHRLVPQPQRRVWHVRNQSADVRQTRRERRE